MLPSANEVVYLFIRPLDISIFLSLLWLRFNFVDFHFFLLLFSMIDPTTTTPDKYNNYYTLYFPLVAFIPSSVSLQFHFSISLFTSNSFHDPSLSIDTHHAQTHPSVVIKHPSTHNSSIAPIRPLARLVMPPVSLQFPYA